MTLSFQKSDKSRAVRSLGLRIALFASLGLFLCSTAQADVTLAGSVGIAKRYRPYGWIPVNVAVQKNGSDTVHGQVQGFADPDPSSHNKNGNGPNLGPPPGVFSTTATLAGPAGSIGVFHLYVRNIDPVEDNLTLQYRTGDERGDGAIIASLPMNGPKTNNMPGLPVKGDDPWVIAIASDPAAFTFLNGRKLGLTHTHSGARDVDTLPKQVNNPYNNNFQNSLLPPVLQLTPAGLPDLPDLSQGYSGVDAMIIRCDAPLDGLTEAQSEAIRNWVAAGGHLIVTSGADPAALNSPVLADLLPASVNPLTHNVPFSYADGQQVGEVAATTLTPKPLPGVKVVSGGATPLVVSGPYGIGRVTVTAFDPTSTVFNAWQGPKAAKFWREMITGGDTRPSSILAYVNGREEADPSYGYYNSDSQLKSAIIRSPSFDAPPVGAIALYLVIYIVVLVPLNYLVLKRMDRREWAWITVPALVVIFAGATYSIGYASKGGQMFVNRVTIAETTSGSHMAGVFTSFGLFSPHRQTYDVAVDDATALLCQANTFRSYYGESQDDSDAGEGQPARFYEGGANPRVQDAAINMWSMRTFDVNTVRDMGGPINGKLSISNGRLVGSVTNATGYRLTGCSVCYGAEEQDIPVLAPGSTAQISIDILGDPNMGGSQFTMFPQTAFNNVADVTETDDMSGRLKSGTVDFIKSLGNADTDYWYGQAGASIEPRLAYRPRRGEAILSGWAEGNGALQPKISVNGSEPRQNGLTLVIIHIPLNGAAQ